MSDRRCLNCGDVHYGRNLCRKCYRKFSKTDWPSYAQDGAPERERGPKKTAHPLHGTWWAMRNRCYNENHPAYKWYGGRGITVCDAWLSDFWAFVQDVGLRPFPGAHLDRIDTDAGYFPGNTRWVTSADNQRNRRPKRAVKCPAGHLYEEHGYINSRGHQVCRTCKNDRRRKVRNG